MNKINTKLILDKSKRLKIPYNNLLQGVAREVVLTRLESLPDKYTIALMRTEEYGLDYYRISNNRSIYAKVKEDGIDGMYLSGMVASLVEDDEDKATIEEFEDGAKAILKIAFDKVTVPVTLYLFPLKESSRVLSDITYKLSYENDKQITLRSLYLEEELSTGFVKLYEKMELFADMELLEIIYRYGKKRTFDGRRLQMMIKEEKEKRALLVDEKRMAHMYELLSSRAFKLKFKSYLSVSKRKEPTIDEVKDIFTKIYKPITDSLIENNVFFGDYMPEVTRYL
ncbi:MAG: hypothetical protein IJR23_01830 [Lachnospiraceae bacterium]|nr:hypothetical protein [Lachnospiraceae bacterium]